MPYYKAVNTKSIAKMGGQAVKYYKTQASENTRLSYNNLVRASPEKASLTSMLR